jgi:hypothetical protein
MQDFKIYWRAGKKWGLRQVIHTPGWEVSSDIRGSFSGIVDLHAFYNVGRDPGVEASIRAPEHVTEPRLGYGFLHAEGTIPPGEFWRPEQMFGRRREIRSLVSPAGTLE